jgi:hypothetical protein
MQNNPALKSKQGVRDASSIGRTDNSWASCESCGTADTQVTSDTLTCYIVRLVVRIPDWIGCANLQWGPGIARSIDINRTSYYIINYNKLYIYIH